MNPIAGKSSSMTSFHPLLLFLLLLLLLCFAHKPPRRVASRGVGAIGDELEASCLLDFSAKTTTMSSHSFYVSFYMGRNKFYIFSSDYSAIHFPTAAVPTNQLLPPPPRDTRTGGRATRNYNGRTASTQHLLCPPIILRRMDGSGGEGELETAIVGMGRQFKSLARGT